MEKIEHLGIAVKSLAASIPLFEKILNAPCYKTETVDTESVRTAFFAVGENKIELLESISPEGVIARFLAQKGEGIHHVALAVTDIHAEMKRLSAEGFELLQAEPRPGADNKMVCFMHPRGTGGVLIELCQEMK